MERIKRVKRKRKYRDSAEDVLGEEARAELLLERSDGRRVNHLIANLEKRNKRRNNESREREELCLGLVGNVAQEIPEVVALRVLKVGAIQNVASVLIVDNRGGEIEV